MRRSFLSMIASMFLILLLLIPFTEYGQNLQHYFFEKANYGREPILISPKPEQSVYHRPVAEELPGTYCLVSYFADKTPISDDQLEQIRKLGIPLRLELYEDGSAEMEIFDRRTVMNFDVANLQFITETGHIPFFYMDGVLVILEGTDRMIFLKQSG